MDTGSNKSLFTLLAVVIFGIFLSLSYWLFQDELKDVLADVLDKSAVKSELLFTEIGFSDPNLEKFGDTSVYLQRTGLTISKDTLEIVNGLPSLKMNFQNGSNGDRIGKDDLVLWLDLTKFPELKKGDIINVSFYAKANTSLNFGTRLGDVLYGVKKTSNLTTEWEHYSVDLKVDTRGTGNQGAIVFWSATPGTVWLSDILVSKDI